MKYLLWLFVLSSALTAHAQSTERLSGYESWRRFSLPDSTRWPRTHYTWLEEEVRDVEHNGMEDNLLTRFTPPAGSQRVEVGPMGLSSTWGAWLRMLPLLPPNTKVRLYNEQVKEEQRDYAAVVRLDVGKEDLQQCADAVRPAMLTEEWQP